MIIKRMVKILIFTYDDENPYCLYELSDDRLVREYNIASDGIVCKYHDDMMFIFKDAILQRRRRKIIKIKNRI